MNHKIVAGNWKMNLSLGPSKALLNDLATLRIPQHTSVIIFPPFPYLMMAIQRLSDTPIKIGAQTLSEHNDGAFTGDVSGSMLKDIGCDFVLIGHSERRQNYSQSNTQLNMKVHQALSCRLTPIFCVGETLSQRESGETLQVIETQLAEGLNGLSKDDIGRIIIAYEPVWAIGTGQVATPNQAEIVHSHIRSFIQSSLFNDPSINTRIIYGGSVNSKNCENLFGQPNIDGGLIGGASLQSNEFSKIIESI